jgi:hypothetical protein
MFARVGYGFGLGRMNLRRLQVSCGVVVLAPCDDLPWGGCVLCM